MIFWGIAAAVVLRILFAADHRAASRHHRADARRRHPAALGLLEDVPADHRRQDHSAHADAAANGGELGFWSAVGLITLADVSMSLDNVLAVAGAAKGSTLVLVIGLAVAIVLMAVASHYIAKLLVASRGSPGSAC